MSDIGSSKSVGISVTKSAVITGTARQETVGGVTGQGFAEGDVKATFKPQPVKTDSSFQTSNGSIAFMKAGAMLTGDGQKTVTTTGMKSLTLGVVAEASAELKVDVTSRVGATYEAGLVKSDGELDLKAKELPATK